MFKSESLPIRIILDSNFFFIPIQFRLDIFRELENVSKNKVEPILLRPVYGELKKLSLQEGMKGKLAEMAVICAETLNILEIEPKSGETVDDLILRLASTWKCPVATNDRALRKKLKKNNITVIFLRQKQRLEIDGNIMLT